MTPAVPPSTPVRPSDTGAEPSRCCEGCDCTSLGSWGLAHGKRQKPVLCCETVRFNLKPDVVKQSSALSACQDGHWLVALAAWLMRLLFYGYAQA